MINLYPWLFIITNYSEYSMINTVRTRPENADFKQLVSLLDKELWERYPTSQAQYEVHNKMAEDVRVVLAYEDETAVACGAFRKIDDLYIEIKRMFVHPEFRGKGISKMVLQELEKWAMEENHHFAKLESGDNQPEALSLYEKAGYQRIENYGPYKDLPESICMKKALLSTK